MKGEIVTTQTEDKVRLYGLYCAPVVANETRFDAVVLTHGLAGNFYSSRFLNYLAHTFLGMGLHVVVGNTRGHDPVNSTVQMGRAKYMGAGLRTSAIANLTWPDGTNFSNHAVTPEWC